MLKGTMVAQIIAVISSFFIAKLYGSEAFGLLSVFIGFSTILSILNSLQLENCIIISKKIKNCNNWFNFLILLIPLISFFCSLLFFPAYLSFFDNRLNSSICFLIFFHSIFLSYNKTHEYLLTRVKKFSVISFAKILLVLVNVSLQFMFYSKFKTNGLIYSSAISIFSIWIYFSIKNRNNIKKTDFKLIKKDIRKNTSIITYLLPSRLINSLAIQSIPILIFAFFNLKETGVYFFSQKILVMPLFIISSSISNVYFEKATDLFHNSREKLYNSTRKIILVNLLIMLSFLVLVNTVGIYILEIILNKNWENLRIYMLILSFLTLARSSFSPISNIIVILNKNSISLIFNIYLLIINCISFYIGFLKNDLLFAIYLLSFFGGLGYFSLAIYFLKVLKKMKK